MLPAKLLDYLLWNKKSNINPIYMRVSIFVYMYICIYVHMCVSFVYIYLI